MRGFLIQEADVLNCVWNVVYLAGYHADVDSVGGCYFIVDFSNLIFFGWKVISIVWLLE